MRRTALVACALFLLSCLLGFGGLLSHAFPGDTETYSRYGRALVNHGRIPYHDFYDEYPPGSVPVFAAPAAIWDAHYVLVFKLLMTACGVGCVLCAVWIVQRLRLTSWRLAPLVLAPILMGPVFLNRYDLLPALLTSLALVSVLRARGVATGALLGAGTAIKIYSVVTLPLAWRRLEGPVRRGRSLKAGPIVAFVVTAGILFLPFFAIAPGGVGFSFKTQIERHLQIETLGSSLLLAGSKLGIHHVDWIAGKPGSIDLGGALPDVVATLSSLLALALVALVAVRYWRGPDTDARLVTAWAAAVAAWTIFGKVLSPQYMTWLAALVPFAAGRRGLHAAAVLLGALMLTQVEYFGGDHGLRDQDWVVWALLLRNLLLVWCFVLLYAQLRPQVVQE
ncbi:MAG TPA: glycosyltransferase family 87 protein [Gaiellaceae bacterium]